VSAPIYWKHQLTGEEVQMDRQQAEAYWKENIRLITILLIVWALVSYGAGIVFAPLLNNFYVGSLPMGFWFAHQGALYVFIILIFVYAFLMDKTDKKYGVNE
jgi:putative solute:sodium symporter small subunit